MMLIIIVFLAWSVIDQLIYIYIYIYIKLGMCSLGGNLAPHPLFCGRIPQVLKSRKPGHG